MKWLVKFADNWADEMDVEGFAIFGTKEFMGFMTLVEDVAKKMDDDHPFTWYIGTNEWLDWYDGKDFKAAFSCEIISDEQAEVIQSLVIGKEFTHYGLFPSSETMVYFLEDIE